MLETEERAVNPEHSPPSEAFGGLVPGSKVLVHPSIPRPDGHREYQVQRVDSAGIVLQGSAPDHSVSVSASSVARLRPAQGQIPAELVLKGRLQWITATRQWTVLPEEPPAGSEHGLDKLASASDPQVVEFIERLQQQGYSAWWVPVAGVREFLAQGGEIIYDLDGRYLKTRDQRSEWILLGRKHGAAAVSLP